MAVLVPRLHIGFLWEMGLILRMLGAGLCGALIGYERAHRFKEAGIRTHLVVAVGSALFIIVSKYGFEDMIGRAGVGLDPSRVAASIVSGIGFLGAGIIFIRNQTITGLTTAAGIWFTAGIGMAMGAGLYWLAGLGTMLIYAVQIALHKYSWGIATTLTMNLKLTIIGEEVDFTPLRKMLHEKYKIGSTKMTKKDGMLFIETSISAQNSLDYAILLDLIKNNPNVRSVELQ